MARRVTTRNPGPTKLLRTLQFARLEFRRSPPLDTMPGQRFNQLLKSSPGTFECHPENRMVFA